MRLDSQGRRVLQGLVQARPVQALAHALVHDAHVVVRRGATATVTRHGGQRLRDARMVPALRSGGHAQARATAAREGDPPTYLHLLQANT